MKNYILLILNLIFVNLTLAATSINTPTVSGHWTLIGSPYNIYQDISVLPNNNLLIDPGVEVVFQGNFKMEIYGRVEANGTPDKYINFRRNDTIGWSNNGLVDGGWKGIRLIFAFNSTDSCSFGFCNFQDMKNNDGFYVDARKIVLHHCNFFHNRSSVGTPIFQMDGMDSSYISGMDYCAFYNNSCITVYQGSNTWSTSPIVSFNTGTYHINHSNFHDNDAVCTFWCLGNVLFANNEVFNNIQKDSIAGTSPLIFLGNAHNNQALLLNNKIYNNFSYGDASLSCLHNIVEITGNYICNNYCMKVGDGSSGCGAVQGGAGIRLQGEGYSYSQSHAVVRNNIIANNYSPYMGGGLYVFYCDAIISNNDFINNRADDRGAAIFINNAQSASDSIKAVVKNNIFYGNYLQTFPGQEINILSAGIFNFSNNWMTKPFHEIVYNVMPYTLKGDTNSNIIGSLPGLVNPTHLADYQENALNADFHLMPSSNCVDKGDTLSVGAVSTDFFGNSRIFGNKIDIGAHELQQASDIESVANNHEFKLYPNPAASVLFLETKIPCSQLTIMDINGATIYSLKDVPDWVSLDVSCFPRGNYFVQFIANNGKTLTEKLTISR